MFRIEGGGALGAHLRKLGLQRAAAYTLRDESFKDDAIVQMLLRSLRLTPVDRAVVAAARLETRLHGNAPRWWTPHILDRSLFAGSRSLVDHAEEGGRRVARQLVERVKA